MRKKMKKFASGGDATQQARYNRKIADIESDYQKALGRGKDAMIAKAKYEQRMADAADDLAKWTRADRTQTRAAESAAEAALKEARRTQGRSIADRDLGSRINPTASEPIKVATPKMDISTPSVSATKAAPRRAATSTRRFAPQAAAPASSPRKTWYDYEAPAKSAPRPAAPATPTKAAGTPSGAPSLYIGERAAREQARNAPGRMGSDISGLARTIGQPNYAAYAQQAALRAKQRAERAKELAEEAAEERRRRAPVPRASDEDWAEAMSRPGGLRFKKGGNAKKKPVMKYAKGGSVDGCAVRGKTRARRTK